MTRSPFVYKPLNGWDWLSYAWFVGCAAFAAVVLADEGYERYVLLGSGLIATLLMAWRHLGWKRSKQREQDPQPVP